MSTPTTRAATPAGRDRAAFVEEAARFVTTEYASLTRAGDPRLAAEAARRHTTVPSLDELGFRRPPRR